MQGEYSCGGHGLAQGDRPGSREGAWPLSQLRAVQTGWPQQPLWGRWGGRLGLVAGECSSGLCSHRALSVPPVLGTQQGRGSGCGGRGQELPAVGGSRPGALAWLVLVGVGGGSRASPAPARLGWV